MFKLAQELAGANLFALLFAAFMFDVPRYTMSLISLALLSLKRQRPGETPLANASVSVIVPAFNSAGGLERTIATLRRQTLPPLEIIVVDDGSTDATRAIAERARSRGYVDTVICHGTRCGRSAALNAAARFARGDLLLTADSDTLFAPTTLARMAAAFRERNVAAASCNIDVTNERDTLTTALQGLEYLMSFSAGRSFLDVIEAIACCSGACSMYRRDVFMRQGGLDVGPGEDLEFTLRLRRLGYTIRFVHNAWVTTAVPDNPVSLLRQRARWDRDALRVRSIMYGEFSLSHPRERLPNTLQRLDFIVLDLFPTLIFPFYLIYLVGLLGAKTPLFLASIYLLMLVISLFNIGLACILFNRRANCFSLAASLIFPLYQGIILKCARFATYTSEILFAASRHDDFVPPRIRRALFG
ncbi:glycosyltransferase [Sinorhizobium medicae]|uniref:glycosyltransferase family 2 protein n=1 Tax=Sinorhizobium medicae TaxID=110321 RepID=UPI0003FAF07A|nr:glycosyltransferase family 2 protein [Sinorhizobium medicae]MBO1944705.1 glycosyltransferase family 2 protein [Sinorhizobium medicae]MDX0445495.1 glycosyltransferase [Sinorhizobium medicae]MDX0487734.1 glycosyltransferase [Sinorhizobium medicae]MDX0499518.1 glycosyltransferase [Sinorhizobium medicae]MDX0528643.1 glycosyltransferase [Sinorhizobium medicae]